MNVSLTPELEKLIQARVATGMYSNASEVVREALRLLFEKERRAEVLYSQLASELDLAIAMAEQGQVRTTTVEDIFEAVRIRNQKQQSA